MQFFILYVRTSNSRMVVSKLSEFPGHSSLGGGTCDESPASPLAMPKSHSSVLKLFKPASKGSAKHCNEKNNS